MGKERSKVSFASALAGMGLSCLHICKININILFVTKMVKNSLHQFYKYKTLFINIM